jgi:hypothetical protein
MAPRAKMARQKNGGRGELEVALHYFFFVWHLYEKTDSEKDPNFGQQHITWGDTGKSRRYATELILRKLSCANQVRQRRRQQRTNPQETSHARECHFLCLSQVNVSYI